MSSVETDTFGRFVTKIQKNVGKFFETFGSQPKDAVRPRKINKELQRTQASGNEQGITLGTKKPIHDVVQKDIVRLKNRSVPLNSDQESKKKVPKV